MLILGILLSLICTVSAAFDIWSSPMEPGWPTIFAVIVPPGTKFSNPTYTWNFPGESSQLCTVAGNSSMPCVGNVLDHVFFTSGTKLVQLTITDATLPQPVKVQSTIVIKPSSAFPVVGRPEIRQIDPVSWNRTVYALYGLMDLGVYQHLGRIHYHTFDHDFSDASNRTSAHKGPSFLPWHRVSMRVTEVCLQNMLKDSNFALPFLDWRLGWTGLDSYLGPTGNPSNSDVVESGPFCNDPNQQPSAKCPKRWILPEDFPSEIKGIKRRFGYYITFYHDQTQAEYDQILAAPIYDAAPFDDTVASHDSFRSGLEGFVGNEYGLAHNGFHLWMGGTMKNTSISFYDPAFLVHHVNVDHFLTSWQEKHGCSDGRSSGNCYSPRDDEPNLQTVAGAIQRKSATGQTVWALSGQMYSDRMYPWGIKISDALVAGRGYRYLADGEKPAPINASVPAPPIAPINETVPVVPPSQVWQPSGSSTVSASMVLCSAVALVATLLL